MKAVCLTSARFCRHRARVTKFDFLSDSKIAGKGCCNGIKCDKTMFHKTLLFEEPTLIVVACAGAGRFHATLRTTYCCGKH